MLAGGLAWWRSKARASLFTSSKTTADSWVADEDACRLSAFFDSCYDESDPVEALRDAVMDQFPPEGDEGLFAAVARKASPFSALAYALGPDAVLDYRAGLGTSCSTPHRSAPSSPRRRKPSP